MQPEGIEFYSIPLTFPAGLSYLLLPNHQSKKNHLLFNVTLNFQIVRLYLKLRFSTLKIKSLAIDLNCHYIILYYYAVNFNAGVSSLASDQAGRSELNANC
jgi:hypothetical protein